MKLLLEFGYDPNRPFGEFGQRPLHRIGSAPNCMEMAHLLLANGADPNIQDKYGSTPIQCAASSGNLEYLNLLLAAGADPAYVSPDGQDALYAALLEGNLECIERLMSLGGDINAQDDRGKTVLSRYAMAGGDIKMIKWLLEHGADKSIPDENGDTPLDWARENGHAEIVKLLE
ncbi:MAG TPA: ankyrin repeat domain-containing protein [Prosthecobacter sp.]